MFCNGFDISYLGGREQETGIRLLYDCFAAIENADKLVIAVADGAVMGGGIELFISCDLRLATSRTTFRMMPSRLSQVYRSEGLARIVGTIGYTAAAELFLTAHPLSSEEALRVGLVTRLIPDSCAAEDYICEVSAGAPAAQLATKLMLRLLSSKRDVTLTEEEWTRLDVLKKLTHEGTHRKEALAAFAEKREPVFRWMEAELWNGMPVT